MAAMSADAPSVLSHVADGVATVTLNRPHRLNAFDDAMGRTFDATIVALATDADVRVIVLTGAGRGFCSGVEMAQLAANEDGRSSGAPPPDRPDPVFDPLVPAAAELRNRYVIGFAIPQPVLVAVNGACAGLGLSIAASCDVRWASSEAFFTTAFSRRGLTAEMGLAATLPPIVGQGAAADLLLSARRVPADEAHRMGLVSAVHEPAELLPAALEWAADVATNVSPRSVRVIKRQLLAARDQTLDAAITSAYREAGRSLRSADFREGVRHFVERRPPRFTGN